MCPLIRGANMCKCWSALNTRTGGACDMLSTTWSSIEPLCFLLEGELISNNIMYRTFDILITINMTYMPYSILIIITKKHHQKNQHKKQLHFFSTEGDPIHCMVTSQTIYSEHLNLVLSCMISNAVETCSIWFGFLITNYGEKWWCPCAVQQEHDTPCPVIFWL